MGPPVRPCPPDSRVRILKSTDDLALARATDDLRRGEIVRIVDGKTAIDILAAELATAHALTELERGGKADLFITPERAATLHITNQRAAAEGDVVAITRLPWIDLVTSIAVADPATDLETPMKGPFPSRPLGADANAARAAIALAKRAAILPAVFAVAAKGPAGDRITADATAILEWRRAPRLRVVSRAALPVQGAEHARVVAFRPTDGGPEHLALLFRPWHEPPLLRLHSACLTGDVLGSMKCDCGPQLRAAVRLVAPTGGIILYLQQEGRGIGLMNKLRAYQLQDQGFDTVDANTRLGFRPEERDFDIACAILKILGIDTVRLLSNNPAKVNALEAGGIKVTERVPHTLPPNPHNRHYLETKRDRQGHFL